jgi:predicted DCC family thiol-disulfide oxidoreductase YuxK
MSKIEVYTDGHCNLCRWMRARVEPLDRNRRIEWLDYNDPEILQRAAPRTREELADEMHTRNADDR